MFVGLLTLMLQIICYINVDLTALKTLPHVKVKKDEFVDQLITCADLWGEIKGLTGFYITRILHKLLLSYLRIVGMTTENDLHVDRYNIESSFIQIEQGDEVEYFVNSDVVIMDDPEFSTVIINAPFEIMRMRFDLEPFKSGFKYKGEAGGKDILMSMTPMEAANTFIEGQLFSLEEIKDYFSSFILAERRIGQLKKADAASVYYDILTIFEETIAGLEKKGLTILDPEFQKAAHTMATEMYQLHYADGSTLFETLGDEFVKSIDRELSNTVYIVSSFVDLVWTPLTAALKEAGAKVMRRSTLSVVK